MWNTAIDHELGQCDICCETSEDDITECHYKKVLAYKLDDTLTLGDTETHDGI